MKRVLLVVLVGVALVTMGATIILYSDKPNSIPVGSDFMSFQRNSDYISASVSQVKGDWFNNPVFTGNGGIQGVWTAVTFVGDGSQLTGIKASATNANFILNFNGNGTNTTNWGVSSFQEIDAQNFFPTNLFTGKTNAVLLSTDGNGQLQPTDFTAATNNDNLHATSNTNFSLLVGSNDTNNDALFGANATNHDWVIGANQTNNDIALSNNLTAALSAALVSPTNKFSGDGSGLTNLTYKYTTNIVGAANFVFGKAYWTNITGNFTFPALTMQDAAAMETLSVWVTNSGASTFTATINGVAGAPGKVVPAVFYCTNASVTEIDVSHFGVQWTNACVSRN